MSRIIVSYNFRISVSTSEIEKALNIKWEDMSDFYVKWNIIHITLSDGREFDYELPEITDYDLKYPDEVEVEED